MSSTRGTESRARRLVSVLKVLKVLKVLMVLECRYRAGFVEEALPCGVIPCELGRKKLERNDALELDVLGLVNDTHATATQAREDSIVGNGATFHIYCSRGPTPARLVTLRSRPSALALRARPRVSQ